MAGRLPMPNSTRWYPRKDVEPRLDERLRAAASEFLRGHSNGRVHAKQRPAWIAFLITLVSGLRGIDVLFWERAALVKAYSAEQGTPLVSGRQGTRDRGSLTDFVGTDG